jgi:hypothetical protein
MACPESARKAREMRRRNPAALSPFESGVCAGLLIPVKPAVSNVPNCRQRAGDEKNCRSYPLVMQETDGESWIRSKILARRRRDMIGAVVSIVTGAAIPGGIFLMCGAFQPELLVSTGEDSGSIRNQSLLSTASAGKDAEPPQNKETATGVHGLAKGDNSNAKFRIESEMKWV